ncbi:MAG: alpha-amylase family glycosyl hydrolase [Bacteroidota bacterium]
MSSKSTMAEQPTKTTEITGMGALPQSAGVFFRVWAPHATSVFVTGTFDEWAEDQHELPHEGEGYYAGWVETAKPGDEYKFCLHTPTGKLLRNDPYARQLVHSAADALIVDPTFDWGEDNFKIPAWNELVIYEMHLGTFHRKEQEEPGDFYTAIERLDYLQKLGINAIELMPITEFPGDLSWGYNPAYPFAVEESYGGVKGLKTFIKAAHERGIAVLIDVVYNHFGPDDMDMWQFDGWSENDLGGIYFYNDWRAETPWGHTRPDYGRPAVKNYIRDNTLMWLEEFRADGLRMDMTAYVRSVSADGDPNKNLHEGHELLRWINSTVRREYPDKLIIAEDMHQLELVTDSAENGGLAFGSQWDSKFVHNVRSVLLQAKDEYKDLKKVEDAILHKYNNDAFRRVIYTESHDEVANGQARLPQEIDPAAASNWFSKKKSALGIIAVLTAPGIPMIFQGQPLLEDKWFCDTDPLDWERLDAFPGNVQLYQDLIHLRRNTEDVTTGLLGQHSRTLHFDQQQGILAYQRWKEDEKDSVVIILNFFNRQHEQLRIKFPFAATWQLRFNSDASIYDDDYGDIGQSTIQTTEDKPTSLPIAAFSGLIYSVER